MHALLTAAVMVSASICGAPPGDDAASLAAEREKTAVELVKRLDSEIKRAHFLQDDAKAEFEAPFEAALQQLIRIGPPAERPLALKVRHEASQLKSVRDRIEIERLSNNLELLTALRRVQRKRDPLSIEVIPPRDLKAITRKLPAFSVNLKCVDVEKTAVWIQLVPHFHGTRRESQWRFEVQDAAGKMLPARPNKDRDRHGGGIKSDGWLPYGESLSTILHMGDFIEIPKPGVYTVTLLYHSRRTIADVEDVKDLDNLIVFRSPSFKLIVGSRIVIESSKADRQVAELPESGIVKLVGGMYDEDDHEFVPPKSSAGQILTLNWQAVPVLLDILADQKVSRHRKAWVLSLLYTIVAEEELNPIDWVGALPDNDGRTGKYNLLGSGRSTMEPEKQQELIARWLKFRDDLLDIREVEGR